MKPLSDRGCTDICCCLFFIVFWVGLIGVFVLATSTGDPLMLLYDSDYLGNRCGTGNFTARKKAFYPRMADDLWEQKAYLMAGAVWNIKMYTLCVDECPTAFDITDPSIVADYGYDPASATTQALGGKTQSSWVSILPTYDVLNRCIPYSESDESESKQCAYPSCTSAEAVAVGATCDLASPTEGAWSMVGDEQEAACLVKVTQVSGQVFTMNTNDEVADMSETLLDYIASAAGWLNDIVSSLQQTALFLAGFGILLPIVLSFAYALFLRFFAGAAIYSCLFLLVVSELLVTCVCYAKAGMALGGVSATTALEALSNASDTVTTATMTLTDPTLVAMVTVEEGNTTLYEISFWAMAVMSILTLVGIAMWRKKLRMAIAIVQEACVVFRTMPSLMLFPFSTVIADVFVCTFFLLGAFLITTTKPESFESAMASLNSTLTALGESEMMGELSEVTSGEADGAVELSAEATSTLAAAEGDDIQYALAAYWFFGFLWTIQFVQAISWTTMSGAVVYWYFFRRPDMPGAEEQQTKLPILKAGGRVLKYHLGSMAFGSLVIALCQFCRAMMAWLDAQTKEMQEANLLLKVVMKCTQCCLWCFEKTIRFITGYGFVYIALEGCSFCNGCWKTFKFLLSHPIQVGINTLVSKLLIMLAMVAIPVACSAAAFAYFEQVMELRNPMYPTFFVLFVSAVVSNACASVFECTITTIFVCCFRDKESFDGDFMSEELAEAFGIERSAADDGKKNYRKEKDAEKEKEKKEGAYEDNPEDECAS